MRVTVDEVAAGLRLSRPGTSPARLTDENLPRMGERLRLRQDFDISRLLAGGAGDPEGAEEVRHVRGRQRHRLGHLGRAGRADRRLHEELRRIKGSAFEVVQKPE